MPASLTVPLGGTTSLPVIVSSPALLVGCWCHWSAAIPPRWNSSAGRYCDQLTPNTHQGVRGWSTITGSDVVPQPSTVNNAGTERMLLRERDVAVGVARATVLQRGRAQLEPVAR